MGFLYSQLFITPKYPQQSFDGQTVIVTGSNTGLGKEAAIHFARLSAAKVILAVRNTKAGETAKSYIEQQICGPRDTVEVWPLDLSSFDSVKAFAERANKELTRVDVLCENAGIATTEKRLAEGHESTITVNVISTFLLALLMLPKLKETAQRHNKNTTLTIVSSDMHTWTRFPERKAASVFAALDRGDTMRERYATSKLLELLVIRHIAPQLAGKGVILNTLTPGLCHSELARESGVWVTILKFLLARSTEVGSRTYLAAATAGEESHGGYMLDGLVANNMVSSFVQSEEGKAVGAKVWKELSEILDSLQPGVVDNI